MNRRVLSVGAAFSKMKESAEETSQFFHDKWAAAEKELRETKRSLADARSLLQDEARETNNLVIRVIDLQTELEAERSARARKTRRIQALESALEAKS